MRAQIDARMLNVCHRNSPDRPRQFTECATAAMFRQMIRLRSGAFRRTNNGHDPRPFCFVPNRQSAAILLEHATAVRVTSGSPKSRSRIENRPYGRTHALVTAFIA